MDLSNNSTSRCKINLFFYRFSLLDHLNLIYFYRYVLYQKMSVLTKNVKLCVLCSFVVKFKKKKFVQTYETLSFSG